MCTVFSTHASSFLGLLRLQELGFLVCSIVKAILSIWTLGYIFVIVALLTSSGTHLIIMFCLQQYSGFLELNGCAYVYNFWLNGICSKHNLELKLDVVVDKS